MNTVHSLVYVAFLVVVTGREDDFNETNIFFDVQQSNSDSNITSDHTRDVSKSSERSTDDAGGSSVSEHQSGSKRSDRLNLSDKVEMKSETIGEYSTNEGGGVAPVDTPDDIITKVPTLRKSNILKPKDEIPLENKQELPQKYASSQTNSPKKMLYTNDALVVINESEINFPDSLESLRENEYFYASEGHKILSSDDQDSNIDDNDSSNTKDVNNEDVHLLFVKDDELNKTLMESWNKTEHFFSSGDLEVGQVVITLLRKYVEKRGTWLRRIKHLSLRSNNITTTGILIDGTSFENRKIDLKEMVDYLKKLTNIYKLATFVSAMHTYEKKGFSFMRSECSGAGSWMHEAESYLKNFKEALHDLEEIREEYNITGHFMFPWDHSYGLISKRKGSLDAFNEIANNTRNQFEELESIFRYYVYPCVYFTILIIGVVGNGTLLLMFARHKEIRTSPNVMVINLAVTDVLNLFINTPLYYVSKFYSEWIYLYGYGCKMFVIFRFAIHSALAFSIVALSVQRYCAAMPTFRRVGANWEISAHLKTFIYVTTVWIASLLCGVPTAIVFQYKDGICFPYVKYQLAVEVLDIFYFSLFVFILPITMIVFSLLTARSLRRSVRSIPGVLRNNNQEVSRHRSAKVVISLAIAYSISHIPRSIWFFMLTFFHFSRKENIFIIFVDEITNYLMFSNSCLNPVALYLASASFRRLFKLYLCRSVQNSERKIVPLNRQTTASSQSKLMSIVETLTSDFNTSKSSLFERKQSMKVQDNDVCISVNPSL